MKFVVGEMEETPRKPTQTPFHPLQNPHGVTEMQAQDSSGGRRASTACTMKLPYRRVLLLIIAAHINNQLLILYIYLILQILTPWAARQVM